MRKLTWIALSLVFLTACNNKKADDKKSTVPGTSEETKPAASGADAALTKWLSEKMLVSTKKEPQYDMWNNLKMHADGSCTDKDNSSATWSVTDGKFNFISVMNISYVMEKKDDTTLVFKRELGDDTYIVKPIQ